MVIIWITPVGQLQEYKKERKVKGIRLGRKLGYKEVEK